MDYRKIYKKYWGVNIPNGYEIHHINFNREDNSPHNLVALPRYLHIEYHKIINKFNNISTPFEKEMRLVYYSNDLRISLLSQLNEILKKCSDYIYMRDNKIQPNGTPL